MEVENNKNNTISTENISSWKTCAICELENIHINDFKSHCEGRRHRSKLRNKNKQSRNEFVRFACDYCKRSFTNQEFYKIHLGTKTHKRNFKKLASTKNLAKPHVDSSRPVSVSFKRGRRITLRSPDKEVLPEFTRKKYKTRNIKTEDLEYAEYITSLTAYLSMRLALDHNVQDFMISVNDREWQAFGDIIIDVFYKEKNTLYAIQCKKVNKTIRQITCLEEVKLHMDREYDKIAQLKTRGMDFNEIKFIVLTTCRTGNDFCKTLTLQPSVLNKWKTGDQDISNEVTVKLKPLTKKNDILNVTGESENIYSFHLTEHLECQLPHVFFYTSQRVTATMVNQLLKSKFDNYPDVTNEYTRYIENWREGKLGGNYKLRKSDVILKVGEILLDPFTVTPKKVQSKQDSFDIWNSVIDQVDLTVVKNEPFTISKICQPFNKIIEQTLSINIDTITKSINLSKGNQSVLSNPIKSYLFEVVQGRLMDDLPLHLVYIIFWKAGKIPLLLSSENQEDCKGFILDVILFMKQMGVNKKFLLKSADLNLSRYKTHLKIFTSLDDIKYFINLDELNIRVSDSFNLSLNTIHSNDPFFFKWVTPNIFFDIALGKYSLKASSYSNSNQYKDDLKIILSDEVKEQLENTLYTKKGLLRVDSVRYNVNKLRGIDPCLF